ncbi:RND transporter [Pseudonocardia spinosispora]|uniref:RND transporter n=1 Tax=Pseudonocardia spinosispora TaxID=103441 RepID=UPI0003FE05A7|nr:RND transporter [Pseudonocardia spinosispora]
MSRSKDTGGRWDRITRFRRPSAVKAAVLDLGWRKVAAGLLVLVMAALVVGGLLRTSVQTGMSSFLPASDPSVADLNDVGRSFGSDPIVVLLEDQKPRELFREQQLMTMIGLEGRLSQLPDVATVYGPGTLLNQIATQAQNFIAELIGRRDGDSNRALAAAREQGKSEAEAQAAKQAVLDEFTVRYGPLIIEGLPSGLPTLRNQAFVNRVVFTADGPKSQWKFVVPSNDSVAILIRPREDADAASVQRLVESVKETVAAAKLPTSKVTVSGVPAVVSALGAQAKSEGPLLGGIALLAVGLCFWFIPWTRRSRRLVPLGTTMLAIAITLAIFGWLHRPLSIGVVAFLSVVLGIGCYYPTYFAVRARVRTVLTVACASAASLATLVLSPLPLVRDLGMTLSIGILLAAVLGVLARRLVYRGDDDAVASSDVIDHDDNDTGAVPLRSILARRGPLAVFAAALVLAGIGWALLPKLPLETNVEQFASGTQAVADAQYVENAIGSSGELDVVLDGPDATSAPAVEWMNKAEEIIITQYGDQAHRVVSLPMLLSFLGRGATPDQIQSALRVLPQYLTGAVLSLDRGTSVMIYGVKIDDLAGTQKLAEGLKQKLPPPPPGFTVKLVGLPIVAVRGQELVSQDRLAANLLGVFAAGLVLALGLRRRWDALRAVTAAVLATGAGLFLLWLSGTALSPITVALGSLTAAVGCEFTVLLSEAGRRRNQALRRAVLLVTATSVVGYAVLVISGIAVVREFGLLLAGAVLLALLSSLCVVRLTAGPDAPSEDPSNDDQPKQNSLQGAH